MSDVKNIDFSTQNVSGLGAGLSLPITQANVANLPADLAARELIANKGAANGYASLDAGGDVPLAQLGNVPAIGLPLAQADVTGLVADLAAKESLANKGAVNGYASLDAGGDVPLGQLGNVPAGVTLPILQSDVTGLVADLAAKDSAPATTATDYFEIAKSFHLATAPAPQGFSDNGGNPTNMVDVFHFYLPFNIVVARFVFEVTQLSAGSFIYFGIYSNDRTTLLINSGQISGATVGIKSPAVGPLLLTKGFYNLGVNMSNQIVNLRVLPAQATWLAILNTPVIHSGVAANPVAAGALPADLGALRARVAGEAFNGTVPILALQAA